MAKQMSEWIIIRCDSMEADSIPSLKAWRQMIRFLLSFTGTIEKVTVRPRVKKEMAKKNS